MMWAFALALVAVQVAPEPPSWTVLPNDRDNAVALQFDVGIAILAACSESGLNVALVGLPQPTEGAYRKLDVSLGDGGLRSSHWTVGRDRSVALAMAPQVYARHFRTADQFTVRVPGNSGEPARRYELTLPSDHQVLDDLLTRCDVALHDDSDATYDPTMSVIVWDRPPRPLPPDRLPRAGHAVVTVECAVSSNGRPRDCRVIDEQPRNSGFTDAALETVRGGRLRQIDGQPIQDGGVFRTRLTINVE